MKSLSFSAALLLVPLMAAAGAPAESVPPFIYYIAPISQGLNERLESLGLLPAHGGDADRKASLLHPLACAGGECRRLLEPPDTNDPKWYATLLALEPTRAGRFAAIHVFFDGWNFSITSDMYDAKLGESGKFEAGPRTFSIYNSDCSHSLHAENNWAVDPDACLLEELGRAFERIAAYWEAQLNPESRKVIAEKLANRDRLPFARDLVPEKDAVCRTQYGDYRVVKDLGDHLWLGFPPDMKDASDSVVIASRCLTGDANACHTD